MVENPWDVDSIQVFSTLKCPECIFDSQEEDIFRLHAVENHPMSFVLFGKKLKEEDNENYGDDYNHDDSTQWCVFMIFCLNRYLNFALGNHTGKVMYFLSCLTKCQRLYVFKLLKCS